jgi:glycosyltransferase involved in cell wall biosynthesis
MKPKIYIFSIFPWKSNLLHREHMLAQSFTRLGYPVCFVERSYSKIFGTKSRNIDGVEVKTVFAFPYLRGVLGFIFGLNDWILTSQVKRMVDFDESSWLILSSPLWARVGSNLKGEGRKLVYDISDDHLAFTTNNIWRKRLKKYEDFAISEADFVTVTSENLLSKLPKDTKYKIFENGVDLALFAQAKPIMREKYQGKIVGFIGGVYKRVDLDLVAACAKKYPNIDFVIIGPTDQSQKLRELEPVANFHYLGPVPWGEIQDYFASLDVGIVPFVSEAEYSWLKTVDSVKVYQYSYFGYPIVTTKYGRVETLKPMVVVAESKEQFVKMVGEALEVKEPKELSVKRRALAAEHDWTAVAREMAEEFHSA